MALLIECTTCRNRNSLKNISCNCGKTLRKASGKVYWIEYYLAGSRKRERIGSSKQAAENRLREVKTAKAEKRHIRKNLNSEINLKQLRDWYLNLDEVIRIIREEDEAKACLVRRFTLKETQAEAILNMRLRRLRKLEELEIKTEHGELMDKKKSFNRLLGNGTLQKNTLQQKLLK